MVPQPPSDDAVGHLRCAFDGDRDRTLLLEAATGARLTYGQVDQLSRDLGARFAAAGVEPGDRVALLLPNSPECVLVVLACMHAGAVAVPVNPKLHPEEVRYILGNAEPRLVFVGSKLREPFARALGEVPPGRVVGVECGGLATAPAEGLDALLPPAAGGPLPRFSRSAAGDVCLVVYTSGTTSRPKGVALPYAAVIGNARAFIARVGMGPEHRFYGYLSQAYLGGLYNLFLVPILAGGSVVVEDVFGPEVALRFWERVALREVTALWLVPSILSVLLSVDRSAEGPRLCRDRIRLACIGTAPLPAALREAFEDRYGIQLFESYGLSETLFVTTNAPSLPQNQGVGPPLPDCRLRILDDDGRELPPGAAGEIVVRTPHLMTAYFRDPQATSAATRGGEFWTGDVGYLDPEGHLQITDRKKDLIIRAGMNVSPREVEEILLAHPRVKEAAVVGLPDPLAGERVVAAVVASGEVTAKELRAHCASFLAGFKVPERVHFLEDLPRSVTGKVQKRRVREALG